MSLLSMYIVKSCKDKKKIYEKVCAVFRLVVKEVVTCAPHIQPSAVVDGETPSISHQALTQQVCLYMSKTHSEIHLQDRGTPGNLFLR